MAAGCASRTSSSAGLSASGDSPPRHRARSGGDADAEHAAAAAEYGAAAEELLEHELELLDDEE